MDYGITFEKIMHGLKIGVAVRGVHMYSQGSNHSPPSLMRAQEKSDEKAQYCQS